MLITAISKQESLKLYNALNEKTVKSLEIRKYLSKDEMKTIPTNVKEKLIVRTLADLTDLDIRKKKCRLIIRNLSFQAIEQVYFI